MGKTIRQEPREIEASGPVTLRLVSANDEKVGVGVGDLLPKEGLLAACQVSEQLREQTGLPDLGESDDEVRGALHHDAFP
jgi:hypothetical protein